MQTNHPKSVGNLRGPNFRVFWGGIKDNHVWSIESVHLLNEVEVYWT